MTVATARGIPAAATVLVPHTSTSVRAARRRLASDLTARGITRPQIDDAVLVLSEILSNALTHARPLASGKVRVSWELQGGLLEMAVTDGGGPTMPHPSPPSLSALGGRGLGIVSSLVANWGVRHAGSDETTVWAALPVTLR